MGSSNDVPYNETFYDNIVAGVKTFDAVASLIISIVNPKSVVDIGCAVGAMLSCLKAKGISEILGVDGLWVDEKQLLIAKDEFMRHDFNTGFLALPKRYDLAISTEVAEHVDRVNADDFIATLVNASDIVVFSAAVPGQSGTCHVNEQWPDYWIEKFSRYGYEVHDCIRESLWNNVDIPVYYRQNMFLFCSKGKASALNMPTIKSQRYNMIHPEFYAIARFNLFDLFKHFYDNNNYDFILSLSYLRRFDLSAKYFMGMVYFQKEEFNNCIDCLEEFLEASGICDSSIRFAAYFTLCIALLKVEEYKKALDVVFLLSEDEIPDEHAESYLQTASEVCAVVEYADGWFMFRKELVRFLLDSGRVAEASEKCGELLELAPDDEAIIGLNGAIRVAIKRKENVQ